MCEGVILNLNYFRKSALIDYFFYFKKELPLCATGDSYRSERGKY